MGAFNDKQRIAQLEGALEECIAMLRAMPANQVNAQAKKAQAVLDAKPVYQPLFAVAMFPVRDDVPPESRFSLQAVLSPDETHLHLHGSGNWKAAAEHR